MRLTREVVDVRFPRSKLQQKVVDLGMITKRDREVGSVFF